MTKYVIVKKAPSDLRKDEWTVKMPPDFSAEINTCTKKKPRDGLMTINYLREVMGAIGYKYIGPEFNPYTACVANQYTGRQFKTDDDVATIVIDAFQRFTPVLFDKYIDAQIKKRPHGTKLIYFVGDFLQTTSFTANGIDQIEPKDVSDYMNDKPEKLMKKLVKNDIPVTPPAASNP